MFPIITTLNKRDNAKKLPIMVMGLVGVFGIIVALVLNEPLINMQAQCAGLVSPNQALHLMLQVVLF
ncbi:MAG: hypothetical protein ACJAS9_000499 [Polaribacter sp.]|jgi:hypothetical protein